MMLPDKNLHSKGCFGKAFLTGLFVIIVTAGIVLSEAWPGITEPGRKDLLVARADIATHTAAEEALGSRGSRGTIRTAEVIQSVSFKKDMSIRDALRFLAAKYRKNIVPSSKVDGSITVGNLYDVTFEEALDAILGYDFKYEQDGNFLRVYTAAEYRKIKEDKDRMVCRVFTLYYVTAQEAKKLVSPVLSSAGTIECSTAAASGISTSEKGVSGGQAGGDSMALHDCVVVYDYPEKITEVEQLIESIDKKPRQVLVEATILSATLTEGMQFGVDLNLLGGVSLTGTEAQAADQYNSAVTAQTALEQIAAGVAGTALEIAGFATVGGSGLRIGVRSGDVAAFITALESVTDVTILANPKILALNKQVGTVFIGTKLGYRSQTTQTDTSTTQKVVFLDTGTKLSFRPYIADDGYIRMDIYPKDSSGELDAEGIPTETTAELTTNIMVKDGQTIVIGGLFRDDVRTQRSQIPLLGDLPLIGAAFRSTSDSNIRQEIIVLLTPHIIEEPDETEGQARADDISRKRYGARQSLQWISRARLAEDRYARAVQYYADADNVAALYELDAALDLRPTYLEALRLKETIIRETQPDNAAKIERIMLEAIEREQSEVWLRR